jgi:hypothetical protein
MLLSPSDESVLGKENLSSGGLPPLPPRRRIGASFLWLYRNPTELLGGDPSSVTVKKFRQTAKQIPDCFISSRRQELYVSFAEADSFQNYYRWKKRHLCVQLMMEMALACSSLTGDELIEQFALEKGMDILTPVQMKELISRIHLYIRTLQRVNSLSGVPPIDALISRMSGHLELIASLPLELPP